MGFLFILFVIGVIIYAGYQSGQAAVEQWRTAAQQLQLTYQPAGLGGKGSIRGTFSGHGVTVDTFTKGSGNSSRTYTRYQLEYRNAVPVDLKITRQGMLQGLGKVFGMQDIEIGNPAFDDHLLVQGALPDRVKALLSIELQSAIRDLASTYADLTVTGSTVEINKSGKDSDAAVIVYTVRRLASFCEAMMQAAGDYSAPPSALEVEDRAPAMPFIEFEPPEIPFDQLTTANPVVPDPPLIPVDSDDVDFHEEAMPEIEAGAPVAEEETIPAGEEMTEPAQPEPNVIMGSEPVDLEEVATELFGTSGGLQLMSKAFEERFKDRMVTGSGELLRIGKFSYDPVFSNTAGVKAVILVCELAGAYSKKKVVAEVVYPLEQYDSLAAKTGTILSISGKLIGQDSMMHRLYVASAQ